MKQSPAAASAIEGVLRSQNEAIDQAMEQARKAHSDGSPSPIPGLADRVEAGIEQLNRLRDAGVIDDADYQA
jgi:hypothetical protein